VSKAKPGHADYLTASVPRRLYGQPQAHKGADWVRVPFKGRRRRRTNAFSAARRRSALIGLATVTSQIAAGKMTALALTTTSARAPAGTCRVADPSAQRRSSQTWYGLFAPAGTPKAVHRQVNAE